MSKIYKYFVEGECEEKLINTLKQPPSNILLPGKVEVFNFINKKITRQRISILEPKTIIILVYDIDVEKTDILEENVKLLNKFGFKVIHHIQSIKKIEDEIVYSTSLKNINEMYGTVGRDEFKKAFIHQTDLVSKLKKHDFDPNKLWIRVNCNEPFAKFSRQESLELIKNKSK